MLRGLALFSTVLSCPVRLCKALLGGAFRAVVSYGGVGSGPAGSSGVWIGKVRHFMARHCIVWHCNVMSSLVGLSSVRSDGSKCCADMWGKALHGLVLLGKASFRQGGLEQSEVQHGTVLSWLGEVQFGVVGWIGGTVL